MILSEQNQTGDLEEIRVLTTLSSYLPTYISQYDTASKRTWNNTVVKAAEKDVPYRSSEVLLFIKKISTVKW